MVSRNGLRLYIRLVPLSIQMTGLPRERVSSQIIRTFHVSVLCLLVKKDELSTEVV